MPEYDSANLEQRMHQIGEQFRQLRLACNVPQEELAASSGIGLSTLKRLERGQGCNLAAFVQLLGALGFASQLDTFFAQLTAEADPGGDVEGRMRRRASSPRGGAAENLQ